MFFPDRPSFFQASEIAGLVGMPETRLIKFAESPGYGIRPSVRAKAGKGAPRLYSMDDLLSVALAWWFFQAGFRSRVIGQVLLDKEVRTILRDSEQWTPQTARSRFLVVRREIAAHEQAGQDILLVTGEKKIALEVKSSERHGFQILPVGSLLRNLWAKLRNQRSEGG